MIIRCSGEPSNTFLFVNDSPCKEGYCEAMLVDASASPLDVARACNKYNAKIKYIVLTHGHYDHVTELADLKRFFREAKTMCHVLENDALADVDANVSYLFDDPRVFPECEQTVEEGDEIILRGESHEKDVSFKVLHTPGHTPGCICLYWEKEGILFTGDTVFADGGIGRTDFKGGDTSKIFESLRRLKKLNADTKFFPGHGRAGILGDELSYIV